MSLRSPKTITCLHVAYGALFGVMVGVLPGSGAGVVAAQEVAIAAGGPRFYFASSKTTKPIEVDASRTAVLRQRISLNLNRPTVATLLAAITRQTGLEFVYSKEGVPINRVIGLRADSITVAAALTEILVDTGLDVLLSPGRQVVLVERRKLGVVPQGVIMGQVTDSNTKRGVNGVEVLLEGTRWRTLTDTTGHYRLVDIDPGTYTLLARRVGYAKLSRAVTVSAEEEQAVDFSLATVALKLNELVTTATGQQRRRDLGNAITTIRADSVLRSAPIRNLTDLLEDRVPGLTVQHTSGAPGDPARLRLRGLGSVMRGNDPVVIVDGVRLYATQSEQRSGNLTNLGANGLRLIAGIGDAAVPGNLPAPSPLDQIDPNIIEKIEIFKGPSAATLYGADAANGVIVITTKRGKPGPTRWNASLVRGRTVTPGRWPEGYYRWGTMPSQGGRIRVCPVFESLCEQDSVVRFQALNDPAFTLLGQGRRTALSLTAAGGSQALTYNVTGSYTDETGLLKLPAFEVDRFRTSFNREAPDWMRQPHHLKSWSVTSNVQALLGPRTDVTLSTTVSRTEQQRSSLETKIPGVAGVYVDTVNGVYYQSFVGGGDARALDVIALPFYLQDYYTRTTASSVNFTTGLNANWRPRPWFTASGQAGLNIIPRKDDLVLPSGLITAIDSGAIIRGVGRSLVSTFNLQGAVHKPLRWGFVFQTSVGANITTTNTADLVSSATKLVPGTSSIAGARLITSAEKQVETSVFGWYIEPRLTGQRLSLSTGIRLDGGSAYGTRITGGVGGGLLGLPKLNGSWMISEEPFFPFKSLFSSLRLRGAYGQAQVQPGAYDRLRLYSGGEQRLLLDRLGNSELRPERSVEFEGGVDADLFDSRLSLELTAYQKTQIDALMPVQLPSSVNGGGSVIRNIGNIRNNGLELTLGLTPVQMPLLTWSAQLHYSRNHNNLVKLGRGVLPNKRQGFVEGYPVGGRWARPILGYTDQNGNNVIERQEIVLGDSLVFMGRLLPAYTTALSTNLVLFGGAVGIAAGFSYDAGMTQVDQTSRQNWVLVRALVDPTSPFSEQAAVLSSLGNPNNPIDVARTTEYGLMQDVSTFRFNSLSVNYRAPARVARLLGAQAITVAVQGSNLGINSTYRGKDPDVNSWSAGEDIQDTGQLPLPRTWQLAMFLQY